MVCDVIFRPSNCSPPVPCRLHYGRDSRYGLDTLRTLSGELPERTGADVVEVEPDVDDQALRILLRIGFSVRAHDRLRWW
jgi:arginase family enzyme